MSRDTFKAIILNGRPGSGKSETIDYIKKIPLEERKRRFHIGEFIAIDDFPMLWAWFEEDAILEELGHERLHTTEDGFFNAEYLWDVLIRRLCLEYEKILAEYDDKEPPTIIIEFSRGKQHGGYERAFKHLTDKVLKEAVDFYVKVDFKESMRKNLQRKNPDKLHSILEHSVEAEKLKILYSECDYDEVTSEDDEFIEIRRIKMPYAILDNQQDLTTNPDESFGNILEKLFQKLWDKRQLLDKE